ncbi:exocyst complex component 1-like isoform X2 [Erpetoichthys calabaricus]|uniref:exocyst complex component 1-like isoform X2 n=1 Tax=Erpetoichthys calabaricus TaxID=27687 RepID=UPI0022345024|nr:exocyst complex component 1-like isoform X2 [Erpetoichthys calabaricus]
MASIRNCLQREIFTPKEERLLGTIQVWKAGKRRKTSILCATVSSECPVQVSLVKVKISDRGQYKPCIYWTLRNMQLVDGRDAVKETCEFHLHLDKVYKWVTNTCKEKYSFLICLWKLNQRYLQNKIKFVNINPEILEDFVPETQDPEIGETGESDRQEEYERYQELLTKETTDLEKLMEQCEQAVADSEAFVQMLMTDLQVLDQANLKEIINSEKQVHLIVQLIEEALKESEHLEKQLCAHEELLHTVKEHMDNIHQLQIIDRNHQKLYEEVIYLVENLTLAEEHAWILNNGNLDEPKDLELCIKAVQALSCCTSTNLTAGHRKLQAVAEQLIKFESLRQNFENRFVNHINKIIVLQGMDQDFILESDIDSLILMSHSARHRKLMSCKPLMEWLKNNNPVIFNDLLMVYSESLGKLYERQLKEFFSLARFKVTGAKDSRRFSFPDTTERSLPPSSNITWPKLNFSVPDRLEMDIGRRQLVDKVLEQVLSQLEHMCIEEQEFIIYFFNVESTEDESEEAQRKDIENAKIAKKAKVGVLPFVSRLQEFLILTENVFRNAEEPRDLNDAYCKLITATFNTIENLSSQSLKTPSQVVMIENFYFIFSFLSELKIPGLDHKRKEAKKKYTHYLNLYVTSNLGLPLEKLSEFFEGVKTRMAQGIKEEEVGFQMAYNKQELRRVIERYPGKEVRKSLETLYKNNFKHLSDPYLLQVVWRMMQDDFIRQYQQFVELIERCYPGSGITMEFTVEDLLKYFSELDCSDVS